MEYCVEYSGLPNQCGRCRSLDHQVRHCPRRDLKPHKRDQKPTLPTHNTVQQPPQKLPPEEPPVPEPCIPDAGPCEIAGTTGEATTTSTTDNPEQEERPTTPPATTMQQEPTEGTPPELQPNEINFPQLHSPGQMATSSSPLTAQQPVTPHTFIWRRKPTEGQPTEKEKGKLKTPSTEKTPLTRQGYRSGRLADDLWEVLQIPGTPTTPKKKLRVLPFIAKHPNYAEYLVDNSKLPFAPITSAPIAELLAGLPWTPHRAKLHIVNEVSQALLKVLIFNNQHTTPIHK